MSAIAIIPARFASTRLPGKPLLRETGKYLIEHVYERIGGAKRIGRRIVATDDERIAAAVRSFGGEVVLTRADHVSGTDRIAEVVRGLVAARAGKPPVAAGPVAPEQAESQIVLNVQGDEPEIEPAYLDRLVERLERDADCPMGTLACPFPAAADPGDPNCVKVVLNQGGRALYFSRGLIPYPRDDRSTGDRNPFLLHIGVYAYRREFLLEFAGWPASAHEQIEKLEQLRALDRGVAIAVERVERASVGIDTPGDYAAFVARCRASASHGRPQV